MNLYYLCASNFRYLYVLELVLTLGLEFVLDANSTFGIYFERDNPGCD